MLFVFFSSNMCYNPFDMNMYRSRESGYEDPWSRE